MGCDTPVTQGYGEELTTVNDEDILLEVGGLELTFEYIEVKEIELYLCGEELGEERLRVNVYIFDIEDYTIESRFGSTAFFVTSSKEGVELTHSFSTGPIHTHIDYCARGILHRAITRRLDFEGSDIRHLLPVFGENSIHRVKFFVDEEDQVVGLQVTKVEVHDRYPLATYIIAEDVFYSEYTIHVFNEVLALLGISPLYPNLDYFEEDFAKLEEWRDHLWDLYVDNRTHNIGEKESFQIGRTQFFDFLLFNGFVDVEVPMFAVEPDQRSSRQGGTVRSNRIDISYYFYSIPVDWLSGLDSVFEEIVDDHESSISRGRYGRQVDRGEVVIGPDWRRISLEYDGLGTFGGRDRRDIVVKDVGGFPLSFVISSFDFESSIGRSDIALDTLYDFFEALGVN